MVRRGATRNVVNAGAIAESQENCRWAARQGKSASEDHLADLSHAEQASRGKELLQMLKRNAAASAQAPAPRASRSKNAANRQARAQRDTEEVIILVKGTFIQLVDSERRHRRRGGRDRAFSDSELFDGFSGDHEEEYMRVTQDAETACHKADGKSPRHGDLSDASTDEPSSEDDAVQARVAAAAAQDDPEERVGQGGMWMQQMPFHEEAAPVQLPGTWWVPVGNAFEAGTAMQFVCVDNSGAQRETAPGEWHCQWTPMACSMQGGFDGMCGNYAYDMSGTACGNEAMGFNSDAMTSPGASSSTSARSSLLVSDSVEEAMKEEMEETPRTTVMLRNLPNSYTRSMLVELIDAEGFQNRYDFVYLPVDFSSQAGLGYAFVNFVSPEDADRCQEHFEGFTGWNIPSEKVCSVTWAGPHQGLVQHVERYRSSPVMHESVPDEWKPALYMAGAGRLDFPPPTQAIRKPKIRRRPEGSTNRVSASAEATA